MVLRVGDGTEPYGATECFDKIMYSCADSHDDLLLVA